MLSSRVFPYTLSPTLSAKKAISVYTTYTKVCGHPFKLVDLAISATPVADKCIESSTQTCKHKQVFLSRMHIATISELELL